jgi:cyclopropane fatty-acyl-phospholipid synthase-like methyltransferase
MKEFDAKTYKEGKGSFNTVDEGLLVSALSTHHNKLVVLDIGCGDGKLTKRIKKTFPDLEITAIDNSPEQMILATAEKSSIYFQLIDIINYSSPSKFDIVYSFYAFPHIPKSKVIEALKSVRRLLKEDGLFYLFTNICRFDTSLATPEDQQACDITFLNNWSSQINLIDMNEMKKMFAESGLNVVKGKELTTGAKIKNYGDMISWMFVLQ